jgi:hypothetical protein
MEKKRIKDELSTVSDLQKKDSERTYIPDMVTAFKLSSRPIKIIITSYFSLFARANLFKMSKILKCTIYQFPDSYLKHAKMIQMLRYFAKKESLYYIPETCEPLEFKRIPTDSIIKLNKLRMGLTENMENSEKALGVIKIVENEDSIEFQKWKIHLNVIDLEKGETLTSEELFKSFEADGAHIRRMVEGAYYGARGVFYKFKKLYDDIDTLDLILDEKLFCLSLIDTRYPTYEHPVKITFRLEKTT